MKTTGNDRERLVGDEGCLRRSGPLEPVWAQVKTVPALFRGKSEASALQALEPQVCLVAAPQRARKGVRNGFEGLILRDPARSSSPGHRCSSVLTLLTAMPEGCVRVRA